MTFPNRLLVIPILLLATSGFAKDVPVRLEECPAAVQTVIREHSSRGTFESVARDEKKKSGGAAVYEAKFTLPDGKRVEVHISPDGKVLQVEDKKPKS